MEVGGGHSGMPRTPEQKESERQRRKLFNAMKKESMSIRDQSYESALVFDKDGNVMPTLSDGDKSSVEIPRKYLTGEYFLSHNHPQGWCFSWQDCNVARFSQEIWAVTKDYIQIFRWKDRSSVDTTHIMNFAKAMQDAQNAAIKAAGDEWERANPRVATSISEITAYYERENREATPIAQEKYRDWFKNNAEKYGYEFSVRRWK